MIYIRNMLNLEGRLRLDGATLAFHDSGGPGPAVVLLHGAGADHRTFADQATALAAHGSRVVLPDLRGHGASRPTSTRLTAPLLVADVEALVAALGLDRPVLVGHSLGGNLAQELVRRTPERYAGLVVLGATWNTGPLSRWERQVLRLAAPGLSLVPARRLPRLMATASATTEAARRDAERAFGQVSKAQFLQIWRATTAFVAPDPSYRTPVPLALVRGEEDRTGNIRTAMPAWARHENVSDVVVPQAGHLVSQDAPQAVTEELVRFLDLLGEAR